MKRMVYLLVLSAILFGLVPTALAQGSKSYLIIANSNTLPSTLDAQVRAAGGVVTNRISQIGVAVAVSSNPNFKNLVRGVRSVIPNVTFQFIDPVRQVALDAEFGNPPFSGDDDTRFDLQWGHDAVNAPEAWTAGSRGAGVRVAVLDTGFDLDHPDLAPNINLGLSKNFVEGETLSYALPDPFSHGSHTAGTIAAADNAFGTIGIAPEAELILVKVLGDAGSGTFEDVAAGIVYAADVGADVINMSLGALVAKSGYFDEDEQVWVTAREVAELRHLNDRAVGYAYQHGTTVIASAGNEAVDFDHTANWIHLPSDSPQAISVSASAPVGWAKDPLNAFLDYPASYTNFGRSGIDFAAPGGDSAYPGNENCTIAGLTRPCWVFDLVFSTGSNLNPNLASYYWSAGTSMAAPHASGIAALIIGEHGGQMHPAQVEAEMKRRATDLGQPGNDPYYGQGRVSSGY